ncbi:Uncharacterised protein [Mycobacteroides abscessus subsp. bolletii]|nr:Uncharacterised protein [Mycobacteroides abscessus]SKF61998.1 Uncharacterised protein [Mycobacteroides abscessus subsp. bolletii]SKH90219.1 Uncharacterised protein [Mycobacteroides abscessus subsp. bolletii]
MVFEPSAGIPPGYCAEFWRSRRDKAARTRGLIIRAVTTPPGTHKAADGLLTVAPITIETAIRLRRAAIRPNDIDDQLCRYLGDGDTDALHLGACVDDMVVGSISCVPDPLVLDGVLYPWRRRGFCILPAHRACGIGRWFYGMFLAELCARNMIPTWGTSREGLIPFYETFGLRRTDSVVNFPGTGLHRVCLYS